MNIEDFKHLESVS